jgi:hypothetical protein
MDLFGVKTLEHCDFYGTRFRSQENTSPNSQLCYAAFLCFVAAIFFE